MRLLIASLLLIPMVAFAGGVRFVGVSVGVTSQSAFTRIEGLQTNTTELNRFIALSSGGTYATDRSLLSTDANASWAYTITAGAWDGPSGACEPVGTTGTGSQYEISYAATDIFAMALSGYIENSNTLKAAARTRLLELTGITDFEVADLSGGNQCILDLGTAVPHIIEAALLLENMGYSGWTLADRQQLASWLVAEAFPLLSWGPTHRKNNWGILTLGGALAVAAYAEGGIASLTKWDSSTVSPTDYLASASALLGDWLSAASGKELDSQCTATVWGLQSYGGFPDELRRSYGVSDCNETSLDFDGVGDSTSYQQKTTAGLARTCEILRRLDGNGTRCFDLTSHGGNDTALYDAAQFSSGSAFQTYPLSDFFTGYKYVAGEYYADAALKDALDDGNVSVQGGHDYAYTRITHGIGIAYAN